MRLMLSALFLGCLTAIPASAGSTRACVLYADSEMRGQDAVAHAYRLANDHVKKTHPTFRLGKVFGNGEYRAPVCRGQDSIELHGDLVAVRLSCVTGGLRPLFFFRACELKETSMTVREIRRGDTVGSSDVVLDKTWMPAQYQPSALSKSLLSAGYRSKARLAQGRVITVDMLEKLAEVPRGRQVMAVVKEGAVEVKLPARALHDSSVEKQVKVRTDSGVTLDAFVVNEGLVSIAAR